ncbi:MAG: protein translocase subunit SecF [Clostridia bacterium]|jgi:preprotein translocase subunit SecF|nr:protein translocase subunit SecF [Clostridia bacterium]
MPKKQLDFIGKRKFWYIFSSVLILISVISFFVQGMNKGIDFTGGNIFEITFEQTVVLDDIRNVVEKYTAVTPSVKNSNTNEFIIRTADMSEESSNAMLTEMQEKLGSIKVNRNERIGPIIGQELISNAVWALVLALILMLIYITIRFKFFFAIAAVVPLMHDVLITVGLFSLFQIEIDSTFVAAILTILGYSINGTIVIFDRIRENMRMGNKESIAVMANNSINQTLGRTINTVVAVIILVLSLLFFGGETTKNFCLALFIGFTAGAYSSIFIASSILTDLIKHFSEGSKKTKQLKTAKAVK